MTPEDAGGAYALHAITSGDSYAGHDCVSFFCPACEGFVSALVYVLESERWPAQCETEATLAKRECDYRCEMSNDELRQLAITMAWERTKQIKDPD